MQRLSTALKSVETVFQEFEEAFALKCIVRKEADSLLRVHETINTAKDPDFVNGLHHH